MVHAPHAQFTTPPRLGIVHITRESPVASTRPETKETAKRGSGSEATDVDALGEIMLIQATMQRQFLRVLIRRLVSDVPAFQEELFLSELQDVIDSLERTKEKSALHRFALKEWERLSEMALDAIASTRASPGKH
jgi:hypothetical protein